MNIFINENWN